MWCSLECNWLVIITPAYLWEFDEQNRFCSAVSEKYFPSEEYNFFVGNTNSLQGKNLLGMTRTLTSIAAKIYNALLRNCVELKIEKIPWKNQNGFQRNRSTTSQILTICWIPKDVRAKNLEATILFVDFSKAFDFIHRGKIGQILLAFGLLKEIAAAIMLLYRNTKVNLRSPDGDTNLFEIVAGVLQGDILAP